MKDRLEDFVRDNRKDFDIFEARPELWEGIEKKVVHKKVIRWRLYISRAAAVAAIFIASFLVQHYFFGGRTNPKGAVSNVDINIPELKEAEVYYTGMINEKMQEVKPLLKEYPSMQKELDTDFYELDSVYYSLKNDLKDNVANHEVIEAMIQNYRMKISILEDMLRFLEQQNESDTTNKTGHDV